MLCIKNYMFETGDESFVLCRAAHEAPPCSGFTLIVAGPAIAENDHSGLCGRSSAGKPLTPRFTGS